MPEERRLFTRPEYETWLRGMPTDYRARCDWRGHQIVLTEGRRWLWTADAEDRQRAALALRTTYHHENIRPTAASLVRPAGGVWN